MKRVILSKRWVFFVGFLLCLCNYFLSFNTKVFADSNSKPVLNVAVASNFYSTANALVDDFGRLHGISVHLSTGSSGMLANQIAQGAPFDVFLSADEEKVEKLASVFKLDESNRSVYALGQLMLVYKKAKEHDCSMQLFLMHEGPARVLLANPLLAPYGKAADYVMASTGVEQSKNGLQFVYGNNVAQVAQMFMQGAAKYAWLAASQKQFFDKEDEYCFVILPSDAYPPIRQSMLVLKSQNKHAKLFQEFLLTKNTQDKIRQHGYALP